MIYPRNMNVLDILLAGLLVVGNLLALPIWYWLLVEPFTRWWRKRNGKH